MDLALSSWAATQASIWALFSTTERGVEHEVGWGHDTHSADMSQEAAIT